MAGKGQRRWDEGAALRPRLARNGGAAGDFVDYCTARMPTSSASMSPYLVKGRGHPSTCWEPRRSPSVRLGSRILINASRGEVWDNHALLVRQQGTPSPAAGDGRGKESPLNELVPHTELATPHIAGYSLEGKARGTWMLGEALCRQLGTPRQDLQSLLPAPEVRELTPGQPADQALIKQLVHLFL